MNVLKCKLIKKDTNGWVPDEVSAMANMKEVYDYYRYRLHRISYNDAKSESKGKDIKVCIKADYPDNAAWNGFRIWVGKGTGTKYEQKSLAAGKDTLAHEFTHAVIGHETKLRTAGTEGIIKEAYADIFACYIDDNWLVGEDVSVKYCSRDMINPEWSGNAKKVGGENYLEYDDFIHDKGGIHRNSTIISHIAYRMETDKFSVKPRDIWYKSLCLGYEKHSDLYDVRKNVVKAARKLKCSDIEIKK